MKNMKKYFNKINFFRATIIFTVGFISRAFINYAFNVNTNYTSILLSSFMIIYIFILIVSEYIYSEFIISFMLKSIYSIVEYNILYMRLKYENIRISFIRKVINSYNNNTSDKMYIKSKNYSLTLKKMGTSNSLNKNSINIPNINSLDLPINQNNNVISENAIYEPYKMFDEGYLHSFRSKTFPSNINELKLRIISPVYKTELAWAFSGRGKKDWWECKFKDVFTIKCSNDFFNFVNKNHDSIKYTPSTLNVSRIRFVHALYDGKYLDEALKKLPVDMRKPYKQYLLDLEKTR